MKKLDKQIKYHFFHWGPFLYKTLLDKKEIESIKKLCSKKTKDYRPNLAGLLRHEHIIDVKKMFPIIAPYFHSYSRAFTDYSGKHLGTKIELVSCWVNYMTKFESNPIHTHDDDLSFVIYINIPKELKIENNKCKANANPGSINFIISLTDTRKDQIINQQTFMPELGDFFIFPASLNHYVNHFQSEGERISISGNLKIK
jgi:uncharacterized protein (TIGR02466 family)